MRSLSELITNEILTEQERREADRIAGNYKKLNMDVFVRRIGGVEKVEEMRKINDKLETMHTFNGNHKQITNTKSNGEDLDEWKKGFMEGYDEAYRRLQEQLR